MEQKEGFVKWFSEISKEDYSIAGSKAALLSHLYNSKLQVPPGFVITTLAFKEIIRSQNISQRISEMLSSLDISNEEKIEQTSSTIMNLFQNTDIRKELSDEILESYDILDVNTGSSDVLDLLNKSHDPFVAVRASIYTENSNVNIKQESFLNISGHKNLLQAIKKCMASLFSKENISSIKESNLPLSNIKIAVIIQRMIEAEKSGVVVTREEGLHPNSLSVKASWGLGLPISQGKVQPDSYIVSSNLEDFRIQKMRVSQKRTALVLGQSGNNEEVNLTEEQSTKRVLDNYEVKRLTQYAKQLEEIYGEPHDIEFAIDKSGIYLLQATPAKFIEYKESDEENVFSEEDNDSTKSEINEKNNAIESEKGDGGTKDLEDVENLVLKALGEDEYHPGDDSGKNSDVPPLNEALPVDSDTLKDMTNEEAEYVIGEKLEEEAKESLTKEWGGEDKD